jgi:VCBS repeat-containing protein
MKTKFLFLIALLFVAVTSFAQTVCPPNESPINLTFYKPVTANLQVGKFAACDPEGNALTWSIVETQTLWKISATGDLFVNDAAAVNNLTAPSTFTVKVLDNGTTNGVLDPKFSTSTIILTEVNTAPVIGAQTFAVNENVINGTNVGQVVATDVNSRQTKTYSIIAGNASGTFAINSTTGVITVANNSLLNYEVTPTAALTVKVQDNATVPLSSQATITINLNDVNEAPVVSNVTIQ